MIAIDRVLNMRQALIVAMIVAFLPAPASAQAPKGSPTERTDSEKKKDAEIDKAYRESVKRNSINTPVKSDPWQTLRPASNDTPKQR
jgi:hypothetical protein